jgi:hypothetical protein
VVRRILFVAVAASVACGGEQSPPEPVVQDWLKPVFRGLDTLLTHDERNKLRATELDSAFIYRTRDLADRVEAMGPVWQRTPAGDTLIAHGENLPGVQVSVFLDLYQQYLQYRSPDLAAALHRMSPEYRSPDLAAALHRMSPDYVANYRAIFAVDSTLLNDDLDGDGRADRLVIESRKSGLVPAEEGGVTERRLALFLDSAAAAKPVWATTWDDMEGALLRQRYRLGDGGSLLVVVHGGGDADSHTLVHVLRGAARPVVTHQIDYGEGDFTMRTAGDSIVVTATGDVRVEGRSEPSSIRCRDGFWPGWQLSFSAADGALRGRQQSCIEKRRGDAAGAGSP